MKWYVLYTRPRCEKKVAERLTVLQLESYCAIISEKRLWSDRVKVVERPILPSYVFVKLEEKHQTKVRMVPGVVNFLYEQGQLATVRNTEMQALKNFVAKYYDHGIQATQYAIGDLVEINSSIIGKTQGIIVSKRKNFVQLYVKSLGFMLTSKLNTDE
jgi:transcription antitermination factor NusG